jgi:hypothetical protein
MSVEAYLEDASFEVLHKPYTVDDVPRVLRRTLRERGADHA